MERKQKHIVIVTHHYPPHVSGVGFVAYNHAERLAALGYKITVITSDTNSQEKSYESGNVRVVRIKALNFSEAWAAPFPIFSPSLPFVLWKYVRNADVVHIHDAFYISSFWAAVIARMQKVPIVLTQHVAMIAHPSRVVVSIEKFVYATTGALVFRLSKLIITFNDRVECFLLSKGVPKSKLLVLLNGVDIDAFNPVSREEKIELKKQFGLSLDKKVLLFVGRFVPKKGFYKVLGIRSEEYQIVCVGGEAPKEDYGADILFPGKVDQKTLAQLYQAADIFILPSESEGFPLTIQEAMASGLPIITTNDPGYAQYNLDKNKILLLDQTDEKTLRNAIEKVLRDEEKLNEMGAYSEQYAKKYFNWTTTISELENIYNRVSNQKSGPPSLVMVTPYFHPKIGGLETIAYNLAKGLDKNGDYKVTVITTNHETKEYRREVIDGIVVHRLPIWLRLSNTPINPLWYWQIKKIIRDEHPVLINVHSPVPFIADVAAAAAGKIPVVLTYHSGSMVKNKWLIDLIIGFYEKVFLRALFRRVDAIVAYSPEFVKGELAPYSYKTRVITPGVDLAEFTPTPLPKDQQVVTFVGRMGHHTQWKGVEILLQAISLVVKNCPDVQLNLVGDGDALDYYRDLAASLNIKEHVTFCGPLRGESLVQAYRDTNVFVLPSISNAESFGIVLVEAMASGRPVIGSNIGGIPRLIDDEESGLLVTPKDPQALASAIERIVTDTALAERFVKASLIKVQEFTWEAQLVKYRSLFSEVRHRAFATRVAIISDAVYPFNKGGKEKRMYDITRRLAAQGYDVTIYCMKWWEGPKRIVQEGVTFYAISPYYPLYAGQRRSIKEALFFALNCFKLLGKDFDVIDVDHIPHLVLFVTKIVCVLKGKKMIATWHEVWGKEYWKKYLGTAGSIAYWVERISIMLPNIIISVSGNTTAALEQIAGNKKDIITISNGLDFSHINNLSAITNGGADVVFAGRLLAHKNLEVLLKAITILAKTRPNIKVTIIGEGPERNALEQLSHEMHLENQVYFQDFFEEHDDLYRFMHGSKVFVLPSTREGFGITALEANASGLPIVTIDHEQNATKELVVPNRNGILVSLNAKELADAIEKLLSLESDKTTYYEYAKKYDWDALIFELREAYDKGLI